mgnify:CR=1 FL=1
MRGLNIILRWLIFEFPWGIDFSLRDLSEKSSTNNGYAATDKYALKNLSDILSFRGKRILDIGSGKGYVMAQSYKLGASRCDGIEISSKLHLTACRNFAKLGIDRDVQSYNLSAKDFSLYNDYDIFFLFNPFPDDIYKHVIDELFTQINGAQIRYIIVYGNGNRKAIENYQTLKVYEGTCPSRGNMISIYKIECSL